jgi:thioredoxin 1
VNVFLVALAAVVGLVLLLQVTVRLRARAMRGKPVPRLPGRTGERLSRASRALVYFFSPSCGACRPLTPRFQEMSRRNSSVFVVDVFQETALARGLHVMGTPSVVEIADGKIVGYHVGGVPADVLGRFS